MYPGRLSVSRTFGDIEAKRQKYGGNPKVVISIPEVKSFKIEDSYDFILLGCDGIFDKLKSQEVVKGAWEGAKRNLPRETCHCTKSAASQSRRCWSNLCKKGRWTTSQWWLFASKTSKNTWKVNWKLFNAISSFSRKRLAKTRLTILPKMPWSLTTNWCKSLRWVASKSAIF